MLLFITVEAVSDVMLYLLLAILFVLSEFCLGRLPIIVHSFIPIIHSD